jgi:hypothetical protein
VDDVAPAVASNVSEPDMRRYMMNTLRLNRLLDELVEAYVDWRETCAWVDDAYGAWASERRPANGGGFEQFMVALDAEERAAEVYARLVRRAGKLPWSDDPLIETTRRVGGGVGRR